MQYLDSTPLDPLHPEPTTMNNHSGIISKRKGTPAAISRHSSRANLALAVEEYADVPFAP